MAEWSNCRFFVLVWFCCCLKCYSVAGRRDDGKYVHVIFMNHLDVGYNGIPQTGFINNILNIYFQEYFPRAINLSQELRSKNYTESFIYTTHPWLVSMYNFCPENFILNNIKLKCPSAMDVANFWKAVGRGDITWHAGPMNMQPENMNQLTFELSLNMTKYLDDFFQIKRDFPVFSQRDVPGMTQAVIPALAKRGIAGVSVGVNPGTSPPAVPKLFRWQFEGSEVLATWHPGGYPLAPGPDPAHPGGLSRDDCVVLDYTDHILCFAFISDNGGPPQNIQEILGYYEILRAEFPGAKIFASTFENYFSAIQPIKEKLPVVTNEIGDTWIQGIASDPYKMAAYRAFSSAVTECFNIKHCYYSDPKLVDAMRFLMKPGEHTWGLPGVYDNVNWTNAMFNKAKTGKNYQNCEQAWEEQRQFLGYAVGSLHDEHPLQDMVKKAISDITPQHPDLTGYEEIRNINKTFTCEDGMAIGFTETGSLSVLFDYMNKINWKSLGPMGEIQYYTYNESDFDYMATVYNYYGGAGFNKANSTLYAHPESRMWQTKLAHFYAKKSTTGCDLLLQVVMKDPQTVSWYGAPKEIWLNYVSRGFTNGYPAGFDITLQWFQKTSTRLPEALMYHFMPTNPGSESSDPSFRWWLSKLGHLVDPGNVVKNGSQYVHAVDSGVYLLDSHGNGLQLLTQDVPVVSIATKKKAPSPFPVPMEPITQKDIVGASFNLYNNIWDTNYILWYPYKKGDENFKARFKINFFCVGDKCDHAG